jgi:hypothetical protein
MAKTTTVGKLKTVDTTLIEDDALVPAFCQMCLYENVTPGVIENLGKFARFFFHYGQEISFAVMQYFIENCRIYHVPILPAYVKKPAGTPLVVGDGENHAFYQNKKKIPYHEWWLKRHIERLAMLNAWLDANDRSTAEFSINFADLSVPRDADGMLILTPDQMRIRDLEDEVKSLRRYIKSDYEWITKIATIVDQQSAIIEKLEKHASPSYHMTDEERALHMR